MSSFRLNFAMNVNALCWQGTMKKILDFIHIGASPIGWQRFIPEHGKKSLTSNDKQTLMDVAPAYKPKQVTRLNGHFADSKARALLASNLCRFITSFRSFIVLTCV